MLGHMYKNVGQSQLTFILDQYGIKREKYLSDFKFELIIEGRMAGAWLCINRNNDLQDSCIYDVWEKHLNIKLGIVNYSIHIGTRYSVIDCISIICK